MRGFSRFNISYDFTYHDENRIGSNAQHHHLFHCLKFCEVVLETLNFHEFPRSCDDPKSVCFFEVLGHIFLYPEIDLWPEMTSANWFRWSFRRKRGSPTFNIVECYNIWKWMLTPVDPKIKVQSDRWNVVIDCDWSERRANASNTFPSTGWSSGKRSCALGACHHEPPGTVVSREGMKPAVWTKITQWILVDRLIQISQLNWLSSPRSLTWETEHAIFMSTFQDRDVSQSFFQLLFFVPCWVSGFGDTGNYVPFGTGNISPINRWSHDIRWTSKCLFCQ